MFSAAKFMLTVSQNGNPVIYFGRRRILRPESSEKLNTCFESKY